MQSPIWLRGSFQDYAISLATVTGGRSVFGRSKQIQSSTAFKCQIPRFENWPRRVIECYRGFFRQLNRSN
jgi:hypothetical protein